MVLHEFLYAQPPLRQDRRSPEPQRMFQTPNRKKAPVGTHERSPRTRRTSRKITQRWEAPPKNSSRWSCTSSWDPFSSEDLFSNVSINKGPSTKRPASVPLKGKWSAMHGTGPEKSIHLSQSIGPEKKSSVIHQSIGPEQTSYVTDRQSRRSVFSTMTVTEIAKIVEQIMEESETLRSETRQRLGGVVERRCVSEKIVAEEVERANEALESKMSEFDQQVGECGRQMTELELSKMDINSAFRERQRNHRQNVQQLDWLVLKRQQDVETKDADDFTGQQEIVDKLAAEQKDWQVLSRELADSSSKTEESVAYLIKEQEKAQYHKQVLNQQLLLNLELLREKPRARRPEVPVAWT